MIFRRRRKPKPAASGEPHATPIVLTIDPALFPGTTALAMRGWAGRTGEVVPVIYGPFPLPVPLPMFATFTARNLDNSLRWALGQTTGLVYVIGWSQGAQIAYKWLRDYGPKSNFPVERVRFICIGNPERAHGGACVVKTPPRKLTGKPFAAYGGCGVPAGNRWYVTDFVRQYDGYGDCATDPNPSAEALAAPDDAIHMDYFTVSLDDDDVVSVAGADNVTYALKPTRLPDRAKQARIEQFYDRPAYISGSNHVD